MSKEEKTARVSLPFVLLIGAGLAWAGSQGSVAVFGAPLFGLSIVLAFSIQVLAFIPAFIFQTEKFFDLVGGLSYTAVIVTALSLNADAGIRAFIMGGLVVIWALRLSLFLFHRVHRAGKDGRFDELKPSFSRFLLTWLIQGLWVSFTISAALVVLTSSDAGTLDGLFWVGLAIWLLGFGFEVIADRQKSRFRARMKNRDQFIRTGLWRLSRHPNYFGEIVLWLGMAVMALPIMHGWQWVALISPLFVTVLLTRISGIPLLEKRADDKWGGQSDYETYKQKTPLLIPGWKR